MGLLESGGGAETFISMALWQNYEHRVIELLCYC